MKVHTPTLIFLVMLSLATNGNSNESTKDSELISAIGSSQCEKVVELLNQGVSPDITYLDYSHKVQIPVIFIASIKTDACVTEALVSHGAEIDTKVSLHIWRAQENH